MKFRAAIALVAFAMPALAQHGGAHAGSFGSRGFAGHAGFSSHPAFSQSGVFTRPAQPVRNGPYAGAGFRSMVRPDQRTPYNPNRLAAGRVPLRRNIYDRRGAGISRGSDRDRDRFDRRRRDFHSWYVNSSPYWPGYPYLFDPNAYNLGLYDWSDPDDSASTSSQPSNEGPEGKAPDPAYDETGVAPLYPHPYPDQRAPYSGQSSAAAPAPFAPEPPLTVIFKSGRAPIKVQNYMMSAKVLTDLDREHYEQIPLDQIDLAQTERINIAAGVDFQIPAASHN